MLLVVLGLLFGKSHGDGGAALVVTQAQAQGAIANPFAVEGQGAGKGAEVGLEPTIEAVGQLVRIDSDEQVAQGGVAGDFAERGAFLARKAKPSALGLGEELGVSLNGGEVVTAGKQGHGDEHQQRPTRIGAVGTARVGEVRLSARSICVPTRICVEFRTDSVHGTGRASQRIPTPIQGGTQILEEDKFFLTNWPKD